MNESKEPWDIPPALPPGHIDDPNKPPATTRQDTHNEEVRRVQVDEEDRLAFRVGVNFITLVLLGVGVYFLVRYFWN